MSDDYFLVSPELVDYINENSGFPAVSEEQVKEILRLDARPSLFGWTSCKVDGCSNTIVAKGWCNAHYRRWKEYGTDPQFLPPRIIFHGTRSCVFLARTCTHCGEFLPINRFSRTKGTNGIYEHRCLKCKAIQNRVNWEKNGARHNRTCRVNDCDKSTGDNKNYCAAHLKLVEKYGTPTPEKQCVGCGKTFLFMWRRGKGTLKYCEECRVMALKISSRVHNHGIRIPEFLRMYYGQDKKCRICRQPFAIDTGEICIDHDHAHCPGQFGCPECIRGLLCRGCNWALGFLESKPNLTPQDYADYLAKQNYKNNKESA
jgi:hypothetical protein